LGSGKLKQLYSSMLRCRMLEERAELLLQEGKIGRGHQTRTGGEAAEVGAMVDLVPRDCVSCGRRDAIVAFIRGMPLSEVVARLFAGTGDAIHNGSSSGATAKTTTGTVAGPLTLAARINISTGVALACKLQKKPNVVVVFSGNDATALNSWRESIDFAVAQKLPIVHVVQDDLGSEPAPARPRAMVNDSDLPVANGIPRLTVDGADAVAVYRVAQEAIRRARQGHGPALIECKTNRWVGSSEVRLASSLSDPSQPQPFDPVSAMETYLQQRGLWSDAWKQRLVDNFSKELDAAIRHAAELPAGARHSSTIKK
jgi:TPP-dependent pyruvate/acetoin dehydrogenase alpha subunit